MMKIIKLTNSGRITIPIEIRRKLGIFGKRVKAELLVKKGRMILKFGKLLDR